MSTALPEYEVYAIRYAERDGVRGENFMGGDPHEGPMPMDYFVWVAVNQERVVVLDTGFNEAMAKKRKRVFLRCPVESLRLIGIDPASVNDVVLSHLHYDHAGNFDRFPAASFHLQESEIHYAVGRYMQYPRIADSFEVDDVCGIVRLNYAQRVVFYHGDDELAPGITLHAAGGHSAGLQFMRVNTRRGWIVLAADVTHFYENLETLRPFPRAFHVGDMLTGFDRLRKLAPSPDHIIPGHDPEVMTHYPPARPDLAGIVVRLDADPLKKRAAPVRRR